MRTLSSLLLAWLLPAVPLVAQNPSPLRTWQVVLPLRRGIALWAHNGTADSIAVPSVDVSDCVNIDVGCGRTLTDTILAPGDSLVLVTVRPRQWNAKYHFRWAHNWMPVGEPPAPESFVIPAWAGPRLDAAAFVEQYVEADYLEPRVLTPDLDGDGKDDLAVAVQSRNGSRGIALMLAREPGFMVDLREVRSWTIYDGLLTLRLGDGSEVSVHCSSPCATDGDLQLRPH